MKQRIRYFCLTLLVMVAGMASAQNVAKIGNNKYETLEAAFAAAQDGATIEMLDDVTLSDKLVVDLGGKAVTLDLGGKTLTGRTNLTSGNLTVKNGTIVGGSQQALNVYGSATDAENYSVLTIANDVTVTADVYGVSLFGVTAGSNGYGAVVNIAGTVTTKGDNKNGAVFVSGNLGKNIATDMNNVINVTGSITSATDAAIALNGNATVNVEGGAVITGNTAITIKRGVLNVKDGATVHATGAENLNPDPNNSGTEMTGAAVSMTDTYNNYGAMSVNITGGTFTSDNTVALFKKEANYTNDATYSVSGGTFSTAVPAEFCAPGYEPKDLGNGQYSVYAPTYEVAIKSVTPKAESWYISGNANIQFVITKDGQAIATKLLNQEQLDKWDIILDENYLTLKSKAAAAKWLQYNFNVVGAGTTTIVFQNKANPEIKVEQEVSISHKLTLTIQPAGTHMVEAGPVEIVTNTKFDGVAIEKFEDYTFTSSDESIATISGTTITPLKAGTITVTATKNDDQTASASANVTFVDAPAKIGKVYYESIGKAMVAAQSGETITLLRDVTESYSFTGNQPRTNDFALTIDLNGHTWSGSAKPYTLRVDYGTITIKDSQGGGGVKYGSDYAFIVSHLAGDYPSKLILENGTFTGKTSVAQVGYPGGSGSNKKYYGGDLVVNGGTFVTVPDEGETYDENGNFKYTLNKLDMVESSYPGGIYSPSTITVNGGKFLKFDPQNNLAEGANTNFVPEGLVSTKSVESGEAWYTISKIVAKIDETTYTSLADAFTAAKDGQTITVLTDIDLPSTINVTKQVTLDLNGKTISNTSDLWVGGNWSFFSVRANGNLTVTGNGTIDAKENDCYTFDVRDGGILTIKDGTFTGNISCVYLYNKGNIGVSTCNIEGGRFFIKQLANTDSDKYRYLLNCHDASYANNAAKFNVTGGSFVNFNPANNQAEGVATNFCAAGYEAVQDGDVWTVQKAPVAKIGETTYTSLAEAFEAAQAGQTITVLTDIDLPSTIAVTKQVTLDLAEKKIFNTSDLWVDGNWSFFSVQAGGNLTVTGDGTIDAKENDCYSFDVRNGGILTIKNGTFTGNISSVYLINEAGTGVSTCNIEGGTFSIKQLDGTSGYNFLLNCRDASYKNNTAKFNVTGGSFVNFNPANNLAEGTETNFCAAGYEAVQDGNVWTVQKAAVAQIEGGAKYETLQAAINACEAGTETTIKLLDNVTDGAGFAIPDGVTNKNIIIDFDGKFYNVTKDAVGSGNTKTQAMHFYSGNTLTLKNGTITSAATSEENKLKMMMQNYCDLTLDGMTIDCSNTNGGTYPDYSGTTYEYWSFKSVPVFNFNTGNATIKNTTITFRDGDNMGLCVDGGTVALGEGVVVNGPVSAVTGTVTITDGKYSGAVTADQATVQISGGVFTVKPADEYCAEGYIVTDNTDEATKAQYPYAVKTKEEAGIFELKDSDTEYGYPEGVDNVLKVTYTRSFSSRQVGNYQAWYVPFDYTITADDENDFKFYRISMIAAAPEAGTVTDVESIYIYLQPVGEGTVLKANRPYVVVPNKAVTEHEFVAENIEKLYPIDPSSRLNEKTTHFYYDFYGNYKKQKYAANEIYAMNGGKIALSTGGNDLGTYRWYIKTTAISDDYAKLNFIFVEGDGETNGISAQTIDGEIQGIYTLGGVKVEHPVKGVNIIKYTDGRTKKIYVK